MAQFEEEIEIVEAEEEEHPVDLEDEEEKEEPFVYDEEEPNLVQAFLAHPIGIEALKEISDRVITDFDDAWQGSEQYRKRCADDWKLFCGELPDKNFPWEDCANIHVPVALETVTRLEARIYGELFGDWSQVFLVTPIGPEDEAIATVLTIHGNWQFRKQIPDFKRQMHRGLYAFLMFGDVTCHSYYDPLTRLNRHEILTPDDFVTPAAYVSVMPDYSDVPWVCKILRRYRHELQAMRDQWHEIDKVMDEAHPSWMDDPDQPLAEALADMSGKELAGEDRNAPRQLLQYEGWFKLPNFEHDRFCQVIVDHKTRNVLKLCIYEQDNWQDKIRFDLQQQELAMYQQQAMAHQEQVSMMEAQAQVAQAQSMSPDPEQQMSGMMALQQLSSVGLPPPPAPPAWIGETGQDPMDPMAIPEPVRKEPIRLYSHAVSIEPLKGTLGMGHGRVQADFNRATNLAMNQFSDAATMANISHYIASDDVKFDGTLSLRPGGVTKVRGVSINDIEKAFVPLKTGQANGQLVEMVNLVKMWAESSMQAPSALSGESGKSGETFRGLAARIEQATKQLSVEAAKFRDFFEAICEKNALLNSLYLRDEEIHFITDHVSRQMQGVKVGRQMYERSYAIEIRADLRFTTMAEKIGEADQLVQMVLSIPILMQNVELVFYVLRKAFEARGRYDVIQILDKQMQQVMMMQQQTGMNPMAPPPPGPGGGEQGGPPPGGGQ